MSSPAISRWNFALYWTRYSCPFLSRVGGLLMLHALLGPAASFSLFLSLGCMYFTQQAEHEVTHDVGVGVGGDCAASLTLGREAPKNACVELPIQLLEL